MEKDGGEERLKERETGCRLPSRRCELDCGVRASSSRQEGRNCLRRSTGARWAASWGEAASALLIEESGPSREWWATGTFGESTIEVKELLGGE